ADGHLGLRFPIEQDDDDSPNSSNFLAIALTDLVKEIERSGAHVADAHPDLDRFHGEVHFEVAFRSSDDEADVASALSAGELEPHQRPGPLEVSEINGVIDVTKSVNVTEHDLVWHHVPPAPPPADCVCHHSGSQPLLYAAALHNHRCTLPRARLQISPRQRLIEIRRDDT